MPMMRSPASISAAKSAGVSSVTHISVELTWVSGYLWLVAGASIHTTALPLESCPVTTRRMLGFLPPASAIACFSFVLDGLEGQGSGRPPPGTGASNMFSMIATMV